MSVESTKSHNLCKLGQTFKKKLDIFKQVKFIHVVHQSIFLGMSIKIHLLTNIQRVSFKKKVFCVFATIWLILRTQIFLFQIDLTKPCIFWINVLCFYVFIDSNPICSRSPHFFNSCFLITHE